MPFGRDRPGFAEVICGKVTSAGWIVGRDGGAERTILAGTVSSVDPLSFRRGSWAHFAKLAVLPAQVARDAHLDGVLPNWIPRRSVAHAAEVAPIDPFDLQPPTGAFVATRLALLLARFLGRRILRLVVPERWAIAVGHVHDAPAGPASKREGRDPGSELFPDPRVNPHRVILPPAGRDWADPFPVRTERGSLVFVEERLASTGRGRIAVFRIDEHGTLAGPEPVLEEPHHLSYPFVFEHEGVWYLLPEAVAGNAVQLYRAVEFPDRWHRDRELLPGFPVADATIAFIRGRWWLFGARGSSPGGDADDLHIFSSDGPLGPWRPHARNPVLSDVRSARPAGRLFEHDGRWYRPSQDGSVRYGYALVVNRIDRLDDGGYRETPVSRVTPDWCPRAIATHTLNSAGDLSVMDAAIRVPRLPGLRRRE
jgi:hypothetical protein